MPVEFSPPDLPQEVEFMGAEMVRDLPAYLDTWAPPAVPVASLAEIKAFNEQAASQRMPYGQALVDGMAAFEASFVGQPALMAFLATGSDAPCSTASIMLATVPPLTAPFWRPMRPLTCLA